MLYTTDLFSMYKFTGHQYYKAAQSFAVELADSIKQAFISYNDGYKQPSDMVPKNIYNALDFRHDHFLMTVMSSYNVFLGMKIVPTNIQMYADEAVAPISWILHYKNRYGNTVVSHVHVEEAYRGNNYGKIIYKSLRDTVSKDGSVCELMPIRKKKELYSYCTYLQLN